MKSVSYWYDNADILQRLQKLPRKMTGMHHARNVAEFVLHELCQKECFDIPRAAYLVDNPDYDCMRGVAGYCKDEQFDQGDIWSCPLDFTAHMRDASFNNAVRKFNRHSCHKHKESIEEVATHIAHELGINDVGCCIVSMPHDNHGILVYEKQIDHPHDKECLENGASLLSFCPIY
jgi:hypothetical protein